MGDAVSVRLEVYLPFRGRTFWRGEESFPPGSTAGEVVRLLGLTEPELAVLINGRNVPGETRLRAGDEVAVLRHAEGGD